MNKTKHQGKDKYWYLDDGGGRRDRHDPWCRCGRVGRGLRTYAWVLKNAKQSKRPIPFDILKAQSFG